MGTLRLIAAASAPSASSHGTVRSAPASSSNSRSGTPVHSLHDTIPCTCPQVRAGGVRPNEVITIYGLLCLPSSEAPRLAQVQCTDVQERPTEFLDLTSLTRDELQQLVPPFEAAFQAHMAAWRLDGKPRTARRFSVYPHWPLPTPAARLLFMLA